MPFISTSQIPPKDGWYYASYDPVYAGVNKNGFRAFFKGKWRKGSIPRKGEEIATFGRFHNDKYEISSYIPFE